MDINYEELIKHAYFDMVTLFMLKQKGYFYRIALVCIINTFVSISLVYGKNVQILFAKAYMALRPFSTLN